MPARKKPTPRGVSVADVRELLSGLDGISQGKKYGYPAYLKGNTFFARFRDGDSVLVLHVGTIDHRDVLMQMEPRAFFFTDHYRNYPAVLIRLAEVPPGLLRDVVTECWRELPSTKAKGGARRRNPSPVR